MIAPPERLTWLRSMLSIPGIVTVVVLSRTLNLCAAALFAYVTLLVSNPSVGLLAHARPRFGRAWSLPRQHRIPTRRS